jgi:hypothetical protein
MKCDSWASLLACTFISAYFGCKSKVKVVTKPLPKDHPFSPLKSSFCSPIETFLGETPCANWDVTSILWRNFPWGMPLLPTRMSLFYKNASFEDCCFSTSRWPFCFAKDAPSPYRDVLLAPQGSFSPRNPCWDPSKCISFMSGKVSASAYKSFQVDNMSVGELNEKMFPMVLKFLWGTHASQDWPKEIMIN